MSPTPDTLLRITRLSPFALEQGPPPRALGVDDWLCYKGRRYGNILVDLERRRPINLLPDRTADTLSL